MLEFGGEALVLTHDAMAEGVHYLPGQDAADIAWKLVATNLSDLAAKGAQPLGVLLGYRFGGDDARFVQGLREVLEHYHVPLLGGDTIGGAGSQVLGLTALGRATHRPVPARSGARAGDELYLTGPVGAAMMGFEALRTGGRRQRGLPQAGAPAGRRTSACPAGHGDDGRVGRAAAGCGANGRSLWRHLRAGPHGRSHCRAGATPRRRATLGG